jgi:hypothetical protein
VEDSLRQRGISLQALIANGITPTDTRMSELVGTCRSQVSLQQPTTHLQAPAEPMRPDASQPGTARTPTNVSKYAIDKIALGSYISFETPEYREYQCRPSEQFSGFTWCQRRSTERHPRGAYVSSHSVLHTSDGRVYYLNRYLEPAFFSPGEVSSDIERLARKFGEQPRLIQMPQRNTATTGVIAYWGNVALQPLDDKETGTLASGRSPGGILLDFSGDFQQSIRQGLPVYKVTGGARICVGGES